MLCGCSLRYHSHIFLHQGEYLLVVIGVLVAPAPKPKPLFKIEPDIKKEDIKIKDNVQNN